MGFKIQSLEIISYDSSTKTFPSYVYSNMGGVPLPYQWDIQGNIVTHWTKGSKYTGTFSEDGNILSGGWRPEEGARKTPENTYDATMTRAHQNHPKTKNYKPYKGIAMEGIIARWYARNTRQGREFDLSAKRISEIVPRGGRVLEVALR